MTIVFIAALLICLLLLLVLYRNLPNKRVFYGFCLILSLTIAAIAHSLFSYQPAQMPADESTIRRITAQQQIFDGWYTDYKKQLDSLDYNWSQCQSIVRDYANDNISINTAYTRLNLLEHQAQGVCDTLNRLSPPISLEDANYNLSTDMLRKTQAYAQQQLATITALRNAADPANIKVESQQEQSRLLTDILVRNAPDALFTAQETVSLRQNLTIPEN